MDKHKVCISPLNQPTPAALLLPQTPPSMSNIACGNVRSVEAAILLHQSACHVSLLLPTWCLLLFNPSLTRRALRSETVSWFPDILGVVLRGLRYSSLHDMLRNIWHGWTRSESGRQTQTLKRRHVFYINCRFIIRGCKLSINELI